MRVPFRIIIPSPDGPNNDRYIVERILPKRFTDLIHDVPFNVLVLKHIETRTVTLANNPITAIGEVTHSIK